MFNTPLRKTSILLILFLLTTSCKHEDKWMVIVYLNKNKMFEYKNGYYPNKNKCQIEGQKLLEQFKIVDTGILECGLNCRYSDNAALTFCEEIAEF